MTTRIQCQLLIAGLLLATIGTGLGQSPVITQQPQSCTNAVGTTATFTVGATGTEPLAYQWQKNTGTWTDLTDCTNTDLCLTNVQTGDAADYRVVVTNIQGAVTSDFAHLTVGQSPMITQQPASWPLASLGASVTNRAFTSGTAPLALQWCLNGAPVPGQTRSTIILTNVQLPDAGDYTLVVTNLYGAVTSKVAVLTVDTNWMRTPNLPNNSPYSFGCAWGDYNNDGYIDLIVANGAGAGIATMDLYRNNRNGTFTRTTTNEVGAVVGDKAQWACVSWADLNNDGYLDLLAGPGWVSLSKARVYMNQRNGSFLSVQAGDLTTYTTHNLKLGVDYDLDGFLEVFERGAVTTLHTFNRLYDADGSGSFSLVKTGSTIPTDLFDSNSATWADFDNDGDPDLFVVNNGGRPDYVYRNDGGGIFTRIITGLLVNSSGNTLNPAWGDYDNDGDLDLVLTKAGSPVLLRNDGGVFVNGPSLPTSFTYGMPLWLDYDNDGLLDLFFVYGQGGSQRNTLLHNNGNGTFTAVTNGLTTEFSDWTVAAASDFDNNGTMDLFITSSSGKNVLYQNRQNTNHWLKFRLKGTASNAGAIGAKVRVLATIRGQSVWQMREISTGAYAQDDPRPNFGLGDATIVDLVRIEWPSGNVQEYSNQGVDQIVPVNEVVLITPVRPAASLGGSVTLTSQRTGTWQWFHDGVALEGQTNKTLNLVNLQVADGGRYSVVAIAGSFQATNFVYLYLDTQFTKITEGPLVTDLGTSPFESIAGDFNGDGYEDIFVPRCNRGLTSLYQNNQDGTFTRVSTPPSQSTVDSWSPGAWGDFDNDGGLDLLAVRDQKSSSFYWNNGGGTFTPSAFDVLSPWNVAVADYDRDGRLDLYFSYISTPNRLYRNTGSRTFRHMSAGEVGPPASVSTFGGVTWADYDDDGWPDLCAPDFRGNRTYMYHNDGRGGFMAASNAVTQATGAALACAWGDFNNDGRLDLLVVNFGGTSQSYLNLGKGVFQVGPLSFTGSYNGASWADYDNDGFLDLFVSAYGSSTNALYHNNGDDSFTKTSTGSIVTDRPIGSPTTGSYWGTWFDYDNNGFLDLYVVNGNDAATVDTANFLYRNNGNSNAWLRVKLIGTTSNRDAVGAKVRVLANYAGQNRWQRRDITGGDAINGGQNYAHFGLGNATRVITVRVEWPSGTVQALANVATNQILPIVEPRRPVLAMEASPSGIVGSLQADTNQAYRIYVSEDLATWSFLTNVTSDASGNAVWSDATPASQRGRFYRATN